MITKRNIYFIYLSKCKIVLIVSPTGPSTGTSAGTGIERFLKFRRERVMAETGLARFRAAKTALGKRTLLSRVNFEIKFLRGRIYVFTAAACTRFSIIDTFLCTYLHRVRFPFYV